MRLPSEILAQLDRARAVPIESEAQRRGLKLKREGRELVGPCLVCGGGEDRFAINPARGLWHCRGCGCGGDIVRLVQHLDRSTFTEALAILTGEERCTVKSVATAPKISAKPPQEKNAEKARWLWSQRQPITPSTPAFAYLRRERGYLGPIPQTLAHLPARDPYPPALIAAFGLAEDKHEPGALVPPAEVSAVHLTKLTASGEKIASTSESKSKIMLGPSLGKPIIIAPPNDLLTIGVTEGIEDALSAHQALGIGAWAAGSAPHMPALAEALWRQAESVSIFAHDDKGRRYAERLAQALYCLDIEVFLEGLAP